MARETLVCDTSIVGHLLSQSQTPERYAQWDESGGVARLIAGVRAVSLVTVGESRAGYLVGRWGTRRTEAYERHLASFVKLPIELDLIGEWARLRAAAQRKGIAIGDNDLWIAATAHSRGHPLVTCDRDHERIAGDLGVEVVFLAPPV